ncbi:CHASE domain-containing protein [Rhodobacter sp. NTK016B]|uniref:ATP-binding protein n=2 Tax=Bacteria TaxID=2 RepID=UPI001A8CF4F0|nr:ATP-binding protein [Rhodobacter sp. NTK016B]MBN8290585.1 CHASE domain-containing protein [Rhodobacter sp. NTK016B]
MRRILRLTSLPAVVALAVVGVIWVTAEWHYRSFSEQNVRHAVQDDVSVLRADIEGTVSANIQLIRGLIATLSTEPDMDAARFAELAAVLEDQNSLIRNLAAAPDMVIRFIYPMEGNSAAIGLNYLETPRQRDAAILARDSGRLVLDGPVDLVQGGVGYIGRFPVFIPDGTEQGRFWGLVSAVIDAEQFYAATGLNDETSPIEVALRDVDQDGAAGAVFYGDPALVDRNPVVTAVSLPFGNWEILAVPRIGWDYRHPEIWVLRMWLFIGAILIVVPSFTMGRLLEERADYVERLQLALRRRGETNDRYLSVSRISRTFVWEQDPQGHLTYLSTSYRHITGLQREPMMGRPLRDLAAVEPPFVPAADWDGIEERIRNRETFSEFICLAETETGEELWLQIAGAPVFDEHDNLLGYRGAGMDVTSVQRARQAADESSRAKSIFLANMSHEIRTPLNGVLGMAQVLETQMNDPDKRAMVTTIRESGQSLNNILNDILDLSKIEANKLGLESTPFQPEETLQRIVALHQVRAEEKGLLLSVSGLTPKGAAREGDVHRFGQILHNLINNAIKFTESGSVSVDVSNKPGQSLIVRIADSGPGMSEDQLKTLFEAFVQGDGSISRRHGGTGLGMSIVNHLVTLMGGTIDVRSVPGEGTNITIDLPFPEREMQREAVGDAPVASELAGLRLLAADDNATNRHVLEAMLRGSGVDLTLVTNGEQAIEAWRKDTYDVMMLDISMPVLGGIAARHQMAQEALETGRPLPPAIAFTANVMSHQIKEYLDEGFVSCVAKPLKKVLLLEAIKVASR